MTQIIDAINIHKNKSVTPMNSQQSAYVPRIEVDQIECTVQSYLLNGTRTLLNQATQACFKLNYLKFKSLLPRTSAIYKNDSWSMEYLVNEGVIHPFMLFINGIFIPWEIMTIVLSQENYYILVDSNVNTIFKDQVRDIKFAQIMALPDHIIYSKYYYENDDSVMFRFNEFGEFDTYDRNTYVIRSGTAHHIVFNYWQASMGVNAFPVLTETSVKLNEDNVVLFKNKKLATGSISNIKRSYDSTYTYESGFESACLEFVQSDEELTQNPAVKIDSTLLTFGDGTNTDADTYDFAIFVNDNYTETVDIISKVSLDALSPIIQSQNAGEEDPEYLADLQTPFVMAMDRTKPYDENVANAIKTMMSYDASLFNSVFLENSNLVIDEYTGLWVNENTAEDGTLTIYRQHDSMIEEYILMLVNGSLYTYYKFASYTTNKYIVPIQGIEDTDIVEFLRFQNVNNTVTDITILNDGEYKEYSTDIINEDMVLFSTETDTDYFEFPSDGLQHFPVDYSIDTDEDGFIKITLDNEFYYGKLLKIGYKNRFQHFSFNLTETTDAYTVDLGDKFMYCNDYSKYFVFYNGRRLGSDHYRLTLPVRPTTPFYKFDIYLTMPICDGDTLDVIYVPSLMQDVVMIDEIPINGDIILDKEVLNHGISIDLFMVWINGKKIPSSHIVDIDSTKIKIIHDENSIETVCVTKYISDIDVITEAFGENEALWDKVIAQLTSEEISTLLGIDGETLTNTETGIYTGAVNIRAIMYELIRDQFVTNPRVDITGAFIYDYQDVDNSVIDEYDSNGNAILPVMDANAEDNLDNVERVYP